MNEARCRNDEQACNWKANVKRTPTRTEQLIYKEQDEDHREPGPATERFHRTFPGHKCPLSPLTVRPRAAVGLFASDCFLHDRSMTAPVCRPPPEFTSAHIPHGAAMTE